MDLNASDGIQIGVGVVLTLTLGAVLWYAWEARAQAKVTERMVEELREQRLASDRPYLLVDVLTSGSLEWPGRLTKVSAAASQTERVEQEKKSWLRAYPKSVPCRIYNAGRGPAKEIEVTMLHPEEAYRTETRGFILPGETWDVQIEQKGTWTVVIRKTQPDHLAEWLGMQDITDVSPPPYNAGIIVDYQDIHEQLWATCVVLGVGEKWERTNGEIEIRRALVPLEQRRIPSKSYALSP